MIAQATDTQLTLALAPFQMCVTCLYSLAQFLSWPQCSRTTSLTRQRDSQATMMIVQAAQMTQLVTLSVARFSNMDHHVRIFCSSPKITTGRLAREIQCAQPPSQHSTPPELPRTLTATLMVPFLAVHGLEQTDNGGRPPLDDAGSEMVV